MNRMSFRLTNSTNNVLTLHLEPWGDEHIMVSGTTVSLEAHGPDDDTLEVEFKENSITVYGWTGSTVSISEKEA